MKHVTEFVNMRDDCVYCLVTAVFGDEKKVHISRNGEEVPIENPMIIETVTDEFTQHWIAFKTGGKAIRIVSRIAGRFKDFRIDEVINDEILKPVLVEILLHEERDFSEVACAEAETYHIQRPTMKLFPCGTVASLVLNLSVTSYNEADKLGILQYYFSETTKFSGEDLIPGLEKAAIKRRC